MTRRIERYLLVEIVPYFLLALSLLTVLVLASQMAEFAEVFVKRDVPPTLVRTLLISLLPRVLVLTLPLSLLVAVMTGLGRLHGDHELAILWASGIGRRHLLAPLLLLALPTSVMTFSLAAFDMPRSMRRVKEIRAELILQGIRLQVKPRVFDDRFAGAILYIGEVDRRTDLWHHIFLALEERGADPTAPSGLTLITAERGRLELGETPDSAQLALYEGVVHRRYRADGPPRYDVEAFGRTRIRFDARSREAEQLQVERGASPPSVKSQIQEMTLPELWAARHDPTLGRRALTEFHKRLAVSASPLVLVAMGVALGTTRRRGGRGYGFGLSILLAAAYYLLLLGGENLARAGRLPPLLALWAGNAVMAGASALQLSERFSLTRTLERMAERLRVTSTTSPPLRVHLILTYESLRARAHQLQWKLLRRFLRPRAKPALLGSGPTIGRAFPLSISDRYIASRFLGLYLTTLVGLWTLFIIFTAFELSSDIFAHQIPAHFVAEYLVCLTPAVLSYLAPPAALMAALVTMSVLSQSGELTALRAAGVSIPRAATPILLASALVAGMIAVWQERVVPPANARQEQLRFYIKKGRFPSAAELAPVSSAAKWMVSWSDGEEAPRSDPSGSLQTNARIPRRILHVASLDPAARRLDAPLILEFSPDRFLVRRRLEADLAQWDAARAAWRLSRVSIWEFEGAHLRSERHAARLWLRDESGAELLAPPPRKPETMTSRQLRAQIRALSERGLDPTDLRIAVERRSANAAAVLIMALFGIPFGVTFGRKGARHAIGLGIAIGLLYWLALGFFEQLGRYEYFSPRVAAWGPNGWLLAGGLYLLFRVRT
jgi:LPS export ABC transporter permease LptF/LPS export ABC transporter permease LptG